MFNYHLYKLGQFIALRLPLKLAYKIAVLCSDVHYVFANIDRSEVIANLKAIFPGKSKKELLKIRIQIFRNFAKYLVDFFRFAELNKEYINRRIKIENIHYLDEALKEGNGVILLSAHFGNWELGGAVIALLGYPLWAVALPHKTKKVNDFFNTQRGSRGMKIITFGKAARACINLLRENKIIALVGDKDFSKKSGIVTDFFGKPAYLPKGPAAFALRNNSPIIPIFTLRNPDDTFTLKFFKPVNRGSGTIAGITFEYKKVIENLVKNYPEQWYMFKKFWIQEKNENLRGYSNS